MSADLLRRAAEKAREVAGAATAGPWFADVGAFAFVMAPDLPEGESVAMVCAGDEGNTEHLSLWHPEVALAVADLLEDLAADREADPYLPKAFDAAGVRVARLLLGESA